MKDILRHILCALIPFLFIQTGCDEKIIEEQEDKKPVEYLELIKAYEADKLVDVVEFLNDGCVIRFGDGSSLSIASSSIEVHDCSSSSPADVRVSQGWWCIDGITVPIKADTSLSRQDSEPVYVYYDGMTLRMYLSNREVLVFRTMKQQELAEKEAELARKQAIPVIRIATDGGAGIYDKKNYVPGTITIEDPGKLYSEETSFTSRMGIRGRGNSTWSFPKKPWKVKLDSKASIFGMGEDKEWCLLANYSDRTLIRNILAMELSELCGFSWTPHMYSVHVYLNEVYQGVYTFCEHKKVSSSRVDIDLDAGDVYLEIEQQQDETTCWWTDMGVPMMFSDPEEPDAQLLAEVKKHFSDFEAALYSNYLEDPDRGYAAYIDVDSFIDYYIVQEISKNTDGNLRKSSFITKRKGGKLEMYHLWDFDLTFGNSGWLSDPEGFYIRDYKPDCTLGDNWFNRMLQDSAFAERLKDRWNELYPELEKMAGFIDEQALILDKAQEENFKVWDINHDVVDWVGVPSLGSYDAEVRFLKDFYTRRIKWLNTEINKL